MTVWMDVLGAFITLGIPFMLIIIACKTINAVTRVNDEESIERRMTW